MKKLPKKIFLGCLFVPVGLVVLGGLIVGIAKVRGVPEPKIVSGVVTEPVPEKVRTALEPRVIPPTETRGKTGTVEPAVRVDIDLEWGTFYIEPGPADRGITVDADYDEALYRLDQEYTVEKGLPTYRLRFRSKVSMLRRALAGRGEENGPGENEITVTLPENVPMDLRIRIKGGEGEMQLGGLAITGLSTDLNMGSFSIEVDRENPVTLSKAHFQVGMGEIDLQDLSSLRATLIEITGGMGEVTADFGNSLLTDTAVVARMRMGELSLQIPDDALYDPNSDLTAILGEVNGSDRGRRLEGDPEQAKRLYVKGSVMLGELSVQEFRTRPRSSFDPR